MAADSSTAVVVGPKELAEELLVQCPANEHGQVLHDLELILREKGLTKADMKVRHLHADGPNGSREGCPPQAA